MSVLVFVLIAVTEYMTKESEERERLPWLMVSGQIVHCGGDVTEDFIAVCGNRAGFHPRLSR